LVSGDIHRREIFDCEGRITEAGMKNSNAKLLPVNSVMIALNGQGKTRGTVALLRIQATCNQSMVSIYPKEPEKLLPEFLYANLHGRYQELRHLTGDSGNDRRGLNMGLIEDIAIPIAPLAEQKRIVTILDEAFDGIDTAKANAEQNVQNARALFESHLQSVFTQRGDGWIEKELAELCDIKHGFTFKSEFFRDKGDYVLLTPGNFYESGGYRDRGEKQKYYCGEIPRGFVLEKGDLLVAMTEQAAGLLGSPIIVPESGKFLHNQRLGLVTKKLGVPWTNEFFFHVFNTKSVRREIHDSASGVKVRHTSPTKIGGVAVSFPTSITEQRAVVSKLDDLDEQTQRLESIYQQKLDALDALKKALLHQAFTAQLTHQSVESVLDPFPTRISNITPTDLHAGILAMAYQLHEKHGKQTGFGHVKAEKIAHMVEAFAGIDLERSPIKDAAGPNDYPHLMRVVHRAKKAGFFSFTRAEGSAYRVTKYRNFDALVERTCQALGARKAHVESLLKLMLPMSSQQAEIFSTVYAAWNNLLLDRQAITDKKIVLEARDNWHPDKMSIQRERFFKAIKWMRENNFVPLGKGRKVGSKAK
jgi:type I restriction enzyme S subunit